MALLRWELRKIWRPGILAAILLLEAVYYWMFPQFYIEHFCNGPQSEAQFDLASDWVERYGPTLVRDRLRNTRPMQWASRRGRPVLNVQMGAVLLSALVLAVVNITVYVIPFLAQGPLQFAACGLDGIWEWGTPWFDWTYGTYLLVLAGLILALSLGAAGLTAFLSQYSGNYIAMLLKAVPLFVAVGVVLGSWLLDRPFTFRPLWDGYGPWVPKGAEAVAAAVLLALGLGLCALACRRQRKRELL